jgi:hypothetical protein
MSKILKGPFSARNLGAGSWVLTSDATDGPEVYLQGIGPGAEFLAGAAFAQLAVAWRGDGVEITATAANGIRALKAASAIIHEPKPRLYESLPLAGFDADARRFWNRVFRLIRIPGGRHLLGFIARRKRGSRGAAKP